MKSFFRTGVCLLLILLGWTCSAGLSAMAENEGQADAPAFIDCADSQRSYGETVAALNRSAAGSLRKRGGKRLYPVLCRTYGGEFGFDAWAPACVVSGPAGCYTLYFDSEAAAEKAVAALSELAEIRYAERDMEVEACAQTDVSFHSTGAKTMEFGPYLLYAGGLSAGQASVAVIDSGVYPHPLYADRILESGFDYIEGDSDSTGDPFGHGTNVAGILADCTQGFPVYLYPIRVLDADGAGSVSNAVNGIREAVEKGVDVINLSLATKRLSAALDAAVTDALNAGITVVSAAGNYSMDTAQVSPANLTQPGMIVVGAAESDGTLSSYSNRGASVDVYAYGSGITCCSNDGLYTEATGTSMAAPHISGLASLLVLTHRGIAPDEIEARIRLSTDLTATVNIPRLTRMIPARPGFSLTLLRMDPEDCVALPAEARPLTAMETVSFQSGDTSVVEIRDGRLIPVRPGQTEITAQCPGLADTVFTVEVTDESCTELLLPQNVKHIEKDAFFGNNSLSHVVLPAGCESVESGAFGACGALKTLVLPDSVTELGDSPFSEAVVICPDSAETLEMLERCGVPYIIAGPEQEAD